MNAKLTSRLIAEFNKTSIGGIFGYNSFSHKRKVQIKREYRIWHNMPKDWHDAESKRIHKQATATFCHVLGITEEELNNRYYGGRIKQ